MKTFLALIFLCVSVPAADTSKAIPDQFRPLYQALNEQLSAKPDSFILSSKEMPRVVTPTSAWPRAFSALRRQIHNVGKIYSQRSTPSRPWE